MQRGNSGKRGWEKGGQGNQTDGGNPADSAHPAKHTATRARGAGAQANARARRRTPDRARGIAPTTTNSATSCRPARPALHLSEGCEAHVWQPWCMCTRTMIAVENGRCAWRVRALSCMHACKASMHATEYAHAHSHACAYVLGCVRATHTLAHNARTHARMPARTDARTHALAHI